MPHLEVIDNAVSVTKWSYASCVANPLDSISGKIRDVKGEDAMAVWVVRAGRNGERESLALSENLVVIGWGDLPDLSQVNTRAKLEELCQETYPSVKSNTLRNWMGQLWSFRGRIRVGDLVVLPLKTRTAIAVGRITSDYQYRPDLPEDSRHTHRVDWLRTDFPRSSFDQDLLYSFGAFMTVCQVQRNNAEHRIQAILSGRASPKEAGAEEATPEELADLEEYARDQIMEYVSRRFKGHDLARLVKHLLDAQGYRTLQPPTGPDGGVDIIAGQGPMGFDSPRLCVQVKSSDSPVDIGVLRELQGVMTNFGANHGLLVSWGGFKNSVLSEARRRYFEIRLWDAGDLVTALLENYERLPEALQAELPLKRIWALVPED